MTPKEKAEELYRTYIDYTHGHFNCKQCVRIAVDEILEELYEGSIDYGISARRRYFEEVKKEIEKL
jgi:hypothetical protein